jgi:hypothetical protein
MADEQITPALDLSEVETELCRLPDVTAVRLVADPVGRPLEVHVLAQAGKAAKQIVRDIQSVALASFGLELDRRIVSVVQLNPNGSRHTDGEHATPAATRPRIVTVQAQSSGLRTTAQVTLSANDDERTGYAEGTIAASARPRLLAQATLDALRQLEPAAEFLDVDSAHVVRAGAHDVVVVLLVSVDPPHENHLSGSSIIRTHTDDAVVRAVLDATNRRLPHLARDNESS